MSGIVVWGGGTPRAMRVHWALEELGLGYEHHLIASRSGETQTAQFTALNPRQKIPVLQDDELLLTESGAIVTYLAETYGEAMGLIPPPGSAARAHYFEWCFFVMTELDAHTLYVIRRHEGLAHLYGESKVAAQAAREYYHKYALVAADILNDARPYILGHTFTAADILLTTTLDWGRAASIEIPAPFEAYLERVHARPAHERAKALCYSVRPDGSRVSI